MIVKDHVASYDRLRRYCLDPMLMLGNQANPAGYEFPVPYKTLDPDGGDLKFDIADLDETQRRGLAREWRTVFDLGTLEHVWDAHAAYVNAAEAVTKSGYFIGQAPIAGWEGHAIHITDAWAIQAFFTLNGFNIIEAWTTTAQGNPWTGPITRNVGKSLLLWYVAQRVDYVERWKAPSQVYQNGVKPSR